MNLSRLTDAGLVAETHKFVKEERMILTSVLQCFREIERRRLYSEYIYKSLHEMAVKHFGYCERSAYRRINAMRLLKELPQIEQKIETGEINLTHMSLAQNLFSQEKKNQNREMPQSTKLEVFEKLATKSAREAEKITISMSSKPEAMRPDRVNQITEELVEFKFSAHERVEQKVIRLRGYLAHKHPNLSLGELFEKLCDIGLEQLDPAKLTAREKRPAAAPKRRVKRGVVRLQIFSLTNGSSAAESSLPKNSRTEEIESVDYTHVDNVQPEIQEPAQAHGCDVRTSIKPQSRAAIRRSVFRQAGSKCEHCGSIRALETDHVTPRGKGGLDVRENMRLLCRPCNQRAAIREFGLRKMDAYLSQ